MNSRLLGAKDLSADRFGFGFRVPSSGDLASDDEVAGPIGQSLGGSCNPLLVSLICASRPYTGGYEDFPRSCQAANSADFEGGTNKTINAHFDSESYALPHKVNDLRPRRVALIGQIGLSDTGENGYAKQF